MKAYFNYLFIALALSVLVLLTPYKALANESIKNFDVTLTAQKNGVMNISEKIVYDFGYGERHGIYRYIPTIAKVGDLYRDMKINFISLTRDGIEEPYSVSNTGEENSVKIGRANRTITGIHEYNINYTVENGVGSNFTDHDEIYWNVTGNSWQVPIEAASITITTDFGAQIEKAICFTGAKSLRETNCIVNQLGDSSTIAISQPLAMNEGFTIVSAFPVNTFPKSTLLHIKPQEESYNILGDIFIIQFLLCNFFIAPLLIIWYFSTKNKKRFGSPTVNFEFPKTSNGKRIIPANAGTIDNAQLDENDIVATIYDLAIRKYILIEQIKKKGKFFGIGGSEEYKLTKLKDFENLSEFEQTLANCIFNNSESTFLKDTSITYSDFSKLEKENFRYLIDSKIYAKNPKSQMGSLLMLGVVSFLFGGFILGPTIMFLSRKLNGRTQIGDELDFKIDGLKIFLKATDRYTTWQAKNLLFLEKMIPYAIALGFIDEFMEQIKILDPDYAPSWYKGNNNFFTSYHVMSSSMSSQVTTTAPSSSSGFSSGSSGGSSGGGGGGGGGGSW